MQLQSIEIQGKYPTEIIEFLLFSHSYFHFSILGFLCDTMGIEK